MLRVLLLFVLSFQVLGSPIQENQFPYEKAKEVLSSDDFEKLLKLKILGDSENFGKEKKIFHVLPDLIMEPGSVDITYDQGKLDIVKQIDTHTSLLMKRVFNTELGELDFFGLERWDMDAEDLDVEKKMILYFWKSDVLKNLEALGYTFAIDADYNDFIAKVLEVKEQTFAVISLDVEKTYTKSTKDIISGLNQSLGNIEIQYYGSDFETEVWNKGLLFSSEVENEYAQVKLYTPYSNSFRKEGQIQLGVNYIGLKSVLDSPSVDLKKLPLLFKHKLNSEIESDLKLHCKIDESYTKNIESKVIKLPSGRVEVSATPAFSNTSQSDSLSACKVVSGQENPGNTFMSQYLQKDFMSKMAETFAMSEQFKQSVISHVIKKQGEMRKMPIAFYEVLKRFPVTRRYCWNVIHTRRSCWKIAWVKVSCRTHRWTTHHCRNETKIVERLERHNKLTQFAYMADLKANFGLEKTYHMRGKSLIHFELIEEQMLDLKDL